MNLKIKVFRIITNILNPLFLSCVIQLIFYNYFNSTIASGKHLFILILLIIQSVTPILLIFLFIKLGFISDFDITKKEERTVYFSLIIFTILTTTYIIKPHLKAPFLIIIPINLALTLSIITIINLFWKISGHTALDTILFLALLLINPIFLILLILIPIIAKSRVVLKKHTVAQTIAGTLLGIITFLITTTAFHSLPTLHPPEKTVNTSTKKSIKKTEENPPQQSNKPTEIQRKKTDDISDTKYQNQLKIIKPNPEKWWEYPDKIETISENPDDNLTILVNKQFKLPADYKPTDLTNLGKTGIKFASKKNGRKIIISPLTQLNKAAQKDDINLAIKSAYRSYQTQKNTYSYWVKKENGNNAKADKYSARAGHSEHQLGTTIDFTSSEANYQIGSIFHNTEAATWLKNNAWKYGFVQSYPENKEHITGYVHESWHYRYIGKTAAQLLHEENICLTEYYN